MNIGVDVNAIIEETYSRNFDLLRPVNRLSNESISEYLEVMYFESENKSTLTLTEFLENNIASIDLHLKTQGAVLIRGATDCGDSFGIVPNKLKEYRDRKDHVVREKDPNEQLKIRESHSDYSISKLFEEDYFPRDPKHLDEFSVYDAGTVSPSTFVPLHNEAASYSSDLVKMPSILTFYCVHPPYNGEGATLLAKNKDVIKDIPKTVINKLKSINHRELESSIIFPSRDNEVAAAIINSILKTIPVKGEKQKNDLEQVRLNSIFAYWQDGFSKTANKKTKEEALTSTNRDIEACGGNAFFDDSDNLHVSFRMNENMIRAVDHLDDDGEVEVLYTDTPYHYSSIEVEIIKKMVELEYGSSFVENNQNEFDRLLYMIVGKSYALNLFLSLEDHLSGEDIKSIQRAMIKNAFRFDYQQGDVLIIDNYRMMHGREPFRCLDRKISLAFAD